MKDIPSTLVIRLSIPDIPDKSSGSGIKVLFSPWETVSWRKKKKNSLKGREKKSLHLFPVQFYHWKEYCRGDTSNIWILIRKVGECLSKIKIHLSFSTPWKALSDRRHFLVGVLRNLNFLFITQLHETMFLFIILS